MITVTLYGLLRLDSGIKELHVDANTVKVLLLRLEEKGLSKDLLAGCNILVNGSAVSHRHKLQDGDAVQLFPPVAGG